MVLRRFSLFSVEADATAAGGGRFQYVRKLHDWVMEVTLATLVCMRFVDAADDAGNAAKRAASSVTDSAADKEGDGGIKGYLTSLLTPLKDKVCWITG